MEKPIGTIEQPISLPIEKIVTENKQVKTFYFKINLDSRPGQFVILWLPRVDEKPFSIAYDRDGYLGLSIARVGRFTEQLFTRQAGDLVGIRGPYGSWFTLNDNYKKILMVGGGYGVAPLASLAEKATKQGITVDFCNGARSKDLLLFQARLKKIKLTLHTTTDDGSAGQKGNVVDSASQLMKKHKYDCVYTCGPELMEAKIAALCQKYNTPSQVSIERYMKCGFGICGACCIDDTGEPMCIKGPVTSGQYAISQKEFGRYHRRASGKKEYFYEH